MEWVAQQQQISTKKWERKKQLQKIWRWFFIERVVCKNWKEVIDTNPTQKKTKIQQEPAKVAGAETNRCWQIKSSATWILLNSKLRTGFTLKEKKKKEQRNKKSDLEPTTDVYVST